MCAGKRRTLRATIVILLTEPYDKEAFQFLSNVTRFLDFFWKLPQIRSSKFYKVMWKHT